MRTIEASVSLQVPPQALCIAITDSSALPKHVGMLNSVHLLSDCLLNRSLRQKSGNFVNRVHQHRKQLRSRWQ